MKIRASGLPGIFPCSIEPKIHPSTREYERLLRSIERRQWTLPARARVRNSEGRLRQWKQTREWGFIHRDYRTMNTDRMTESAPHRRA